LHRFDTVAEYDGQTDRATDTHTKTDARQLKCMKHYILSCVKNHVPF